MKNYGCDINKMRQEANILMKSFNPTERLSIAMTVLDYTLAEENMTMEEMLSVREEVINEIGEAEKWED